MFSLLRRRPDPATILTSRLFDERSFYKSFVSDLKRCNRSVVIESPYMTCKRAAELAPIFRKLINRGVKVRINTRFPGHHDEYLRIQAWRALKQLKAIGVKVKLCNDYRHRKVAILDDAILWEGSLNILSQNNSREVMRRIESLELCRQMVRFTGLNRWSW